GTAGAAAGPGGNAVGGRAGVTSGSGPQGSFSSAYKGGVAVGPQGAAAAGGRVGTATGPGGTVSGATRGAAATGPYGAAAYRGGVAVGPGGAVAAGGAAARGAYGTYYRSAAAVTGQATTVRQNFRNFAQDNPLLAARWIGPTYRPVAWATLAGFAGYSAYAAAPAYYDYGETVVYSGDTVVFNGETEVPAEQYAQQAVEIANVGSEAKADPKQGEWQQLGVFAMVGEGEEKSTNIFQLAINKDGVIGGEYYNALTDETSPVAGSVKKTTQRAAWTVADKKFPVYEAGIANLTKDETTMLVHFSKDKAQQFMLVRIEQPEGEKPAGGK
ncbi:MAG: protocadherin, partial [Gemmataceae bacterium]